MARAVARSVVGSAVLEAILRPRTDLVEEQAAGGGWFESEHGALRGYSRHVEVKRAPDGSDGDGTRWLVTQTVTFQVGIPYFGWLLVPAVKRALARPGRDRPPWWAPPQRLDDRAARALGALALLSVVFGFLNTLFTQTITFAGEEFGAGNSAQGVAGSVVRVGGVIALVVVAAADRRGRRAALLFSATAGCALAATGALAPSLPWLTASQMLARSFATALLILVAIVAAEEMPAGSRAYAVSIVAMCGGLGAGVCVAALKLADLGPRGWRVIYLIPLLGLLAVSTLRRHLAESRRYEAPHPEAHVAGHGRRLLLLAVSGVLANVFVAPQSQFGNRFLQTERGFSGGQIALLTIAAGTPAVVGIVAGGRIADVRGRRVVAAFALTLGTLFTVSFFFADGWGLWVWALLGNVVSAASIPALGVYGPELFPTGLRGKANGVIGVAGLAGSAVGLVGAGVMSDRFGSIGPAMAVLAVGPMLLAALVVAAYPETARRELEDINPEDRAPEDRAPSP